MLENGVLSRTSEFGCDYVSVSDLFGAFVHIWEDLTLLAERYTYESFQLLGISGDRELIILTYPMSQMLRGTPRLLSGNGCVWLDDDAEVKIISMPRKEICEA